MEKKTSLRDIAREVGVSTALVSYVLNNKVQEKRVGRDMARKIREVATALNYTPDKIARSLRTRKTNWTVIYASSEENPKKLAELLKVLVDRQVDGLIIVPVEHCNKTIQELTKQRFPFVLIDRVLPGIDANMITVNNEGAAYR